MICWYVVIERIYLLKFEEEREGVYLKFRSLFEEPIGGLSSPQGLPRMSIPIAIIMSSWFWLWAKNEHYWFHTLVKKVSGFTRIYTRVQSSKIANFLDVFEDQKIAKMDIIFCHDPQVVKCRKWFLLYTYIDFKYKNEHIHRVWVTFSALISKS